MATTVDHYAVLQVRPDAEYEVIAAAHRSLARRTHPDVAGGTIEGMRRINDAWRVLGNATARAAYDLERSLRSGREHGVPVMLPQRPSSADELHNDLRGPLAARRAPTAASSTVLDFGRYEGWSLRQLARHDPAFLEWLARAPAGRRYRNEIDALLVPGAKAG